MKKVLLLTVALALFATAWGCSSSKNESDAANNVKSAIIPADTKAVFLADNSNLGNGSIFNKSIASDIGDINLVTSILYGINEAGKTSEIIFTTPNGNVRAQVAGINEIGNTNKYYELYVDNFIAVDGVRDANGYIASNSGFDGRQLLMDKTGRIYDLSSVGCNNLQKRNNFARIAVVGDNAYGICDSLENDANRFKIELPTMKSAKVNEGMMLNRDATTNELNFVENFVTFNSGDLLVFDTNSASVFPGSEFKTEIPYHLGLDTANLTQYLNFKMPAGVNPIFYTYNITDGTGTNGTKYSATIAAKNPATLTDTDVNDSLDVFFTEAKAKGLSTSGQVYTVNIENRYESPIVVLANDGAYTCPNTGTSGALDTNNCYKASSYMVLYHVSLQDRTIVRKEIANKKLETAVDIDQVKDNRVYWEDNITTGAVTTPYLRWLDLNDGAFGEKVNVEPNLPLDGGPATFLAYTDNGKIYSRETTSSRRDFYYVKDGSAVTPVPFYTATDTAVIDVPTTDVDPLFGNIVFFRTRGVTSGNSAIQLVDCSTGDIKASINATYLTLPIRPWIF